MHAELRDRGYRAACVGSRPICARTPPSPAAPPAPSAKKVATWILTRPGDLAEDNRVALAQITARCAERQATRALVRDFADMLCHRRGKHLEAWARQAETSPVSELRGFAKGLRKTGPPSPPGSPSPTAHAPSKATSTER